MIALGEAANAERRPGGSLARFLVAQSQTLPREEPGKTVVVAFTDPNDLLSYTLTDAFVPTDGRVRYANVVRHVSRWAFWIPFVGWITNPATAHTGYERDPDVIRLMACGSGSDARC